MRRFAILVCVLVTGWGTALAPPAVASSRPPRSLYVDDDGAQCGSAAYTSIQAAVDAAHRGDRVRVCPGRYAERVVIDEAISLIGQPAAISALNCFDEQASSPDDVDTTVVPVLEPPDEAETPVLRLEADRVEVAGLLIQGVDDQEADVVGDYSLFDAALTVNDARAGWRIHDNLFRLNFLAAELGSDGSRMSRFDHNCLRDNEYSVANQRYTLSRATIDGNETFRSGSTGYELGWGYRGTSNVTLEDNTSVRDAYAAVYAQNGERMTVRDNVIRQPGTGIIAMDDKYLNIRGNLVDRAGFNTSLANGITLGRGLIDARVLHNTVVGTTAGAQMFVNRADGEPPITGLVVHGNTITKGSLSGLTTSFYANLTGALFADNTFSENQRSGLILAPGSHGNQLIRNRADGNLQYGIRLASGTDDNLMFRNRMHDNGLADAIDETAVTTDGSTVLANQWQRNDCTTDIPAGEIC